MGRRSRKRRHFMPWSQLPTAGRQMVEAPGWHNQIYALVAADGTIRYIGKTSTPLAVRLTRHVTNPLRSLEDWIRSERPEIRLISFASDANVDTMEMDWIARVRVQWKLLNVDPGGNFRDADGAPRPRHETDRQLVCARRAPDRQRAGSDT